MKICFFAHNEKTNENGADISLMNIVSELVNRGIEVIIATPNRKIDPFIKNKNVKFVYIPTISMRTRLEDVSLKNKIKEFVKKNINKAYFLNGYKTIKKIDPDIIHINGIDSEVGAKIASKLDIPYVWHIRQLLEEDFGMRLHNEKEIYKLLSDANSVIAISKTVEKKFQNILNRNLSLIYNGIQLDEYVVNKDKKFGKEKNTKILLAGRFVRQKGQLEAVKAINVLVQDGIDNIKLILAGRIQDVNYYNEIKSFIKSQEIDKYI